MDEKLDQTKVLNSPPSAKIWASLGSANAFPSIIGWSSGLVLLNVIDPLLNGCSSTEAKLSIYLSSWPP